MNEFLCCCGCLAYFTLGPEKYKGQENSLILDVNGLGFFV